MRAFDLYKPAVGSVALVTGAGSGIGRCFALRLAAFGYDLVLVGLDEDILDGVAEEIHTLYNNVSCRCLSLDLAEVDSAERLFKWCCEGDIKPRVVVNNAGVFAYCDLIDVDAERMERLLMLHCITLTKLCRLFAAQMVQVGGGYILNMSSYSQWMPFPGFSLYGASKSYVNNFSVSLSKEVEESGVVVSAIAPAGVATTLYGLPEDLQCLGLKLGVLISADSCARRALKALKRGRRSSVPDWWNIIFIPLCRHLPGFVERWLRCNTKRFQK